MDEEKGVIKNNNMKLKTSWHLQQYWEEFKREGNQSATMSNISEQNKMLRRTFRAPDREPSVSIPEPTSIDEARNICAPSTFNNSNEQNNESNDMMTGSNDDDEDNDNDTASEVASGGERKRNRAFKFIRRPCPVTGSFTSVTSSNSI